MTPSGQTGEYYPADNTKQDDWFSIQISQNEVFQLWVDKCRILNFNLENKYTSTTKTAPVIERRMPSLVKVKNYIILAAGYDGAFLSSVSYYNIAEDKWSDS